MKYFSDKAILSFLQLTSQFGKELTREGWSEQARWREQRMRNLKGLALRWQQRSEREK